LPRWISRKGRRRGITGRDAVPETPTLIRIEAQ
jgi:hypothetical protein